MRELPLKWAKDDGESTPAGTESDAVHLPFLSAVRCNEQEVGMEYLLTRLLLRDGGRSLGLILVLLGYVGDGRWLISHPSGGVVQPPFICPPSLYSVRHPSLFKQF